MKQYPQRAGKRRAFMSLACALTVSLGSAVIAAGAGASVKHATPIPVTIGYPSATVADAPLFVGVGTGIFAKYGLNVSLVQIGSSSVVATAVESGSVKFAADAAVNVLLGSNTGAPIEGISEFDNGLALGLVVSTAFAQQNNITLQTPLKTVFKDLVGSTEGASSPTIIGQANVLLRSYGVDPSTVHQVTLASPAADQTALIRGQIQWFVTGEPLPLQIQSLGQGLVVASARNSTAWNVKQLNLILAANTGFANSNPALTKKVVAAVHAAAAFVGNHSAESLSALQTYLPGISRAILLKSLYTLHWPTTTSAFNANIWRSSLAFDIKSGQLPSGSGNTAKEGSVWTNKFIGSN